MTNNTDIVCWQIHISGLVQGVGFRPFIYRLAIQFQLKGWVENRNDGVFIKAEANHHKLKLFINAIKTEKPPASNIFSINYKEIKCENFIDFSIIKSKNTSNEVTEVSPDISVCSDCLSDLHKQEHRINYPFINCTNCGPRFTIIKDLPYDREKTTMAPFLLCKKCEKEYTSILDRRFHAQPVACNNCGPSYQLHINNTCIYNFNKILEETCRLLENGKIISIKGLGGYHMACDAKNEDAVSRLRKLKNRDGKPFAVMFKSRQIMDSYVIINKEEDELLQSWRNPIVLLSDKNKLAHSVSVGFATTGCILPYMPFHYLLFEKLKLDVIVLTSGNISDEPIIIDDTEAINKLGAISDAVITYNREIYNRTDDSVCFVANKKMRLIRRSRSFTPSPSRLTLNVEGIFATGAELVNCFCIGKGNQAILSQHIGDLKNIETLEFYKESVKQFNKLFRFKANLIAHDLHPDYLSTQFAIESTVTKIAIQHHHAHIAACMAEHQLDEKVIGIALDGIGYGDDGNIWGAEFFINDLSDYQRYTHFKYIPMPGGDKATKHPWRMALSYLFDIYGNDAVSMPLDFLKDIPDFEKNLVGEMLIKNINCPLTSSAGRLFDAVSALVNLVGNSNFHAEAPMRLEAAIDHNCHDFYSFEINKVIDFSSLIKELIMDLNKKTNIGIIAAKFHNTIINVIFAVAENIKKTSGINKVVLSGGSFQNKYLLEKTEDRLFDAGFEVFSHSKSPSNDGGLALGQIVIAAKKRELGLI